MVKGISGVLQPINQTFCSGLQGQSMTTIINLQDVLQGVQYKYWTAMLVFSTFLLFNTLFNLFVKVKSEKWLWLKPAMNEWAIIPAVFLFVLILSQVIGFRGI